jgi:hypothetical protein
MQATSMDVEAAKRQGWREQHILVVSDEDERLDFLERQLIRSIGERLYGQGHGPSARPIETGRLRSSKENRSRFPVSCG